MEEVMHKQSPPGLRFKLEKESTCLNIKKVNCTKIKIKKLILLFNKKYNLNYWIFFNF